MKAPSAVALGEDPSQRQGSGGGGVGGPNNVNMGGGGFVARRAATPGLSEMRDRAASAQPMNPYAGTTYSCACV